MTCWVLQSRACRESMPVHVTYAHLGMQEGKVANPQKMNQSFIGSNFPPPPGTFGTVWRHIWLQKMGGEEVPVAAGGCLAKDSAESDTIEVT